MQGIFIDDWSQDCRICKKNYQAVFWKMRNFLGMNQITSKNCNKSSWMQVNKILLARDRPEQFPSFFCMQFSMESWTTMGWSRVSKAYQFLKVSSRVKIIIFRNLQLFNDWIELIKSFLLKKIPGINVFFCADLWSAKVFSMLITFNWSLTSPVILDTHVAFEPS